MDKLGAAPDHMVKSFVESYLRNDGLLIIKLVAENSSDIISAELICGLWDHYRENKRIVEQLSRNDQYVADMDDEYHSDDEMPFGTFRDSQRPLTKGDGNLRPRRPPPPVPFMPGVYKPPIPPKPGMPLKIDEVDTPARAPFRLTQPIFDPNKAKRDRERKDEERARYHKR